MLRRCCILRRGTHTTNLAPPDMERAVKRRAHLDKRRVSESQWMPHAVEPTPQDATTLYRQMLKEGYKILELTDKNFFKRKLREEFEITARQTSSRVRGLMYEKGQWMLKNKMGGLM